MGFNQCFKCVANFSSVKNQTECAPFCIKNKCDENNYCLKEFPKSTGGCVPLIKNGIKANILENCKIYESGNVENMKKPKCAQCKAGFLVQNGYCVKSCKCEIGKKCSDCGDVGFCDLSLQGGVCRKLNFKQVIKNCGEYFPMKNSHLSTVCGACQEKLFLNKKKTECHTKQRILV